MHITSSNYYNQVPLASAKRIGFTANSQRAPFYPETLETIDSVYRDYKKSLCETSISDVKSIALKLSQETQTPKKDVLEAMQLVTQFSNMKSLKVISDAINKQNVKSIGDDGMCLQFHTRNSNLDNINKNRFYTESGINRSLSYVFNKKSLAPISYKKDGKMGIILDEEKISQLEEIKKSQPEEFEKVAKSKDLKYFYISGWETGIPVIDRTKSLEDTTRELLIRAKSENKPIEKALDEPLLRRINDLGLKPVIIKNENSATELSVYNQMKPAQMSKLQLTNVIEANSIYRTSELPNISDGQKAALNDMTAKYLEDSLCVYTPEKMSSDLKKIHEKIMDYANSKGKDVLYVRPEMKLKSTDYIHYSYKKINKIDPSKFISIHSLKNYNELYPDKQPISPDNTILVFLDDCAISGDSMKTIRRCSISEAGISKQYSLLFANLKGTDEAGTVFYLNNGKNPADLIDVDRINLKSLKRDKKLKHVIGLPVYSYNPSAIIFPYMAPDNNSEIASNIALLHNLKYTSQNFSNSNSRNYETAPQTYYYSGSKTMTSNVKKTAVEYVNIIGLNPTTIEKGTDDNKIKFNEPPSFWEKIFSFIHK